MSLRIDVSSPVPVFEQLRAQVVRAVEAGELSPGSRLPSGRQLARDLDVAPGTVAKAYQLLETSGVTTASRRHGTVVSEQAALAEAERTRRLCELARSYAAAATGWGIDAEVARRTVLEALDGSSVTQPSCSPSSRASAAAPS